MKHAKIHLLLFMIGLVFSLGVPDTVHALIAADNNSFNLNFRFNSPGARACGMGGAFIGLADDATAAYTNPAGLTILTKPEVSIEQKVGEYENIFTLYGPPNSQDFTETSSGFTFLSLVYQTKKATLSLYRHELINIRSEDNFDKYPPNYIHMERDIMAVTNGVGIGFKATDNLSLGGSIGFAQMRYYCTTGLYNDATFSPPEEYIVRIDGEDISTQLNLSLLWNPFGNLNIGLVYRQGPEFNTTYDYYNYNSANSVFDLEYTTKYTLKVPDVYGVGISYRFNFGLTMAADVNYIEYSDLMKDFRFPDGSTVFGPTSTSDFDADDTFEIHAGVEYVFDINNTPVAVRCGYTHKPEHRIYYTGSDPQWKSWAPEGDDDNIFAFGLGAAFSEWLQIDGAASFGDLEKEYIVSLVYRF